ncbi:hypothetical protein SISSUDRAFT_1061829 [Sistotremastrum suecicum HHB10207 ss-3]|uniref:Uncharacterized protein n=1 Tax=Sistotremastrum suecicum HHB10207 ss-3 TaxID=1314776 RepID=A0A166DMA9_9AGAM|nr:hypothetical protein SISSUDRAFT_1061829 [Sistotremastrum suecicum HHB10207 ss-3]
MAAPVFNPALDIQQNFEILLMHEVAEYQDRDHERNDVYNVARGKPLWPFLTVADPISETLLSIRRYVIFHNMRPHLRKLPISRPTRINSILYMCRAFFRSHRTTCARALAAEEGA